MINKIVPMGQMKVYNVVDEIYKLNSNSFHESVIDINKKGIYTMTIALNDVSSYKLIRRTISLGFVSISFVQKSTISNIISCISIWKRLNEYHK